MKHKNKASHRFQGIVMLLFFAAVSFPAHTGEEETVVANGDKQTVQLESLYAVRDSKTAPLRAMTRAEREIAKKPALLNRSDADLKLEKTSKGVEYVNLKHGFQNAVLIKRNADGSFSSECVDSLKSANAFFNKTQSGTVSYDQ